MRSFIHLRRWEWALLPALLLAFLGAVIPFEQQCTQIRDKVLRLHVVANSNSDRDQAQKLRVRDRILAETGAQLQAALSRADAEQRVTLLLPEIERAATAQLQADGCSDSVTAELIDMYFPTRTYTTATLPAGQYRALRITIGAGAGENWWCVMFPPMCLSAAVGREPSDDSVTQLEDVLTDREFAIVTQPENYTVRLKIVEWWAQFTEWLF